MAARDDGTTQLWLRSLESEQELPLPGTEGATSPFWKPDSEWVAFNGDGGMIVVGRDGGDARVVGIGDDREVVWSPDGRRIAVLGAAGMEVVDAVTGGVFADIAVPDQIPNHLNYPSWQRVAP